MNGLTATYQALAEYTPLTDVVGSKIAIGSREPRTWGPDDKTVSIYIAGPVDYAMDYLDTVITANCRAGTEKDALDIAALVVGATNRKEAPGGGRWYCSQLPTIPPVDEADSYNVPVQIQIKGQRALN